MSLSADTIISLHGITKRFGSVTAIEDISLAIQPGKIHALLGENGAGKSTLVSILYGLLQPDSGNIQLDGQSIRLRHPQDAIKYGIAMVQQHLSLIEDFTVLENLMLGQEFINPFGMDTHKAERYFSELSQQYRLDLPLLKRVGDLPVGIQQRVEIAKALSRHPRVIIFDEPTAALVTREIDEFLQTMIHLRNQGMAVIFITHRLHEVMRCADTVTVLRQGKTVLQMDKDHLNQDQMAQAIIGDIPSSEQYTHPPIGNLLFHAENLCAHGNPAITNINLTLHQSEIMGIAGVAGNGQETLINTIMGLNKTASGSIALNGQSIQSLSTAKRRLLGITLIPQDRRRHALLPGFPIWENILLNREAAGMQSKTMLNPSKVQHKSASLLQDYAVKASSVMQSISSLSGGHQQRVILARELSTNPKVIIAYNPARGLDIRASRFVHERLLTAAKNGTALLLFSSELSELFLLCQYIAVIHQGALSESRPKSEWTQESLGNAMTGGSA